MAEKDIFRDTPLRYIGYCNEVGEAFRPLVSRRIVEATYVVAFGYVLADTVDKAYKKKQQYENAPNQRSKVLICAGDSLIWQSLATIVIPGFVINRVCSWTSNLLDSKFYRIPAGCCRRPCKRPFFIPILATLAGLLCIPIINEPVCYGVRICAGSIHMLGKTAFSKNKAPISTAVSLLSIPFIVHPIDSTVTYLMDHTYRKVFD